MSNFNNLPKGTIVYVNEELYRYQGQLPMKQYTMEITGRKTNGYATRELSHGLQLFASQIKWISSYPINESKLQPGTQIEMRDDLCITRKLFGGHYWYGPNELQGKVGTILGPTLNFKGGFDVKFPGIPQKQTVWPGLIRRIIKSTK